MARGGLGNPRASDRVLDRPLENRLVQVLSTALARAAVDLEACRREDTLPSPGSAGVRMLAQERAGQLHPAGTMPEIAFVVPAAGAGAEGLAGAAQKAGTRRPRRAALPTSPRAVTITTEQRRRVVA